jgi:hypothetical protein
MSLDIKDVQQERLACLKLPLGVYKHWKGGEYVLFAITLDESNLRILVHYYSLEKKTRWTRSYDDFTKDVDGNGLSRRFHYLRRAKPDELLAALSLEVDKLSQVE